MSRQLAGESRVQARGHAQSTRCRRGRRMTPIMRRHRDRCTLLGTVSSAPAIAATLLSGAPPFRAKRGLATRFGVGVPLHVRGTLDELAVGRPEGWAPKSRSQPSRTARRSGRCAAQPLWRPVPRARHGLAEATLCDSLREKQQRGADAQGRGAAVCSDKVDRSQFERAVTNKGLCRRPSYLNNGTH